ncbi:MAG: right-handed parallel beta-helix repeat-containing protein, partial [Bacteroidota bacterium]|nr:right-handed parallel beta-helix repeat-containing protein [Bacteroidota bacterium]
TFNNVALPSSNAISSDTIPAFAKGTLLEGKTYYIISDVTVQKGDTLYAQPGANVIVKNNAQVSVQGVLLLQGTQAEPVSFNSDSNTPGSWGGFQCDSAQAVTIKWTHVENTGGPDPSGSARKSLFVNAKINVDIEDSWFTNGQDDLIRLQSGASITILRNTITSSGSTDGEAINLKSGVTGVVAYNVIYSQAGSGIKLETSSTVPFPQTKVDVNNNTLVSNGWRRGAAEPGRGISVGVNAIGRIFNNIMVNNYQGLEIFTDADLTTSYGNNLFYASIDNFTDNTTTPAVSISLRDNFYPSDGLGMPQPTDIISTGVGNSNPSFVSFDGTVLAPNGAKNKNDFHLQVGSPALNAGNPTYNNDIGAYTSDDRGNKH